MVGENISIMKDKLDYAPQAPMNHKQQDFNFYFDPPIRLSKFVNRRWKAEILGEIEYIKQQVYDK